MSDATGTTSYSYSYGYNDDGQVASETDVGLPSLAASRSFAYDKAGDLSTLDGNAGYGYNSAPQLISSPASADPDQSSPEPTSYAYDALGDRTSATLFGGLPTTYSYNQAGELTGSSLSSTSYTYNGDGLRMSKTSGAGTQQYAYDTTSTVPQLLTDATNNYLYGPDGLPIEQIFSGGTVQYLHHDQLGSTRQITDSTGNTVGTFTYNPYGTLQASAGTATTPFGYTSAYTDPETGLQYLDNRYYDPQTGQFITSDPLNAITQQPYQYANDNPINETDPSGLCGGLSSWGDFWSNCGSDALNYASGAASAIGSFVGNHYGQIAEGAAAIGCITEVVGPISCVVLTGGAFGAATVQNLTSDCPSGATEAIDVLGTIPGIEVAGAGAIGALEGDGVGQLAVKGTAAYVGVGAQVGTSAYDANRPSCGCG